MTPRTSKPSVDDLGALTVEEPGRRVQDASRSASSCFGVPRRAGSHRPPRPVAAADETVDGFAGRPGASSCRTLCDCTTLYDMLYVTEEELGRYEGCIGDCLTSLESTPDCFDVRTRYHFCVLRTSSCVDAEEPEYPGHGAFSPVAEEACPDEAAETAACLEQTGA